ncbi:TIGR01458 family HAD-type hydrolase [Flammeovirga kamogawensis]|uniref:Haloacid dehalogenase-like hydrolase domain-containing protein 2 n=1 Tax=Flammeovirga kamogawensis TaxID=373891 RepID=A0ABX8GZ13_9BACT|nr:TIGR01458 family HAD-type hydrolase [Flammeovirga kamogawensis]MBB6458999.1 HAD superfamily hydrolase (TIGR01458 family) [Flammeovirga kamogawensis]QWG08573.1 TIGR01458 family HAD-type hydrolase [Flammeovirga kamogawensis]TRX66865.1 TIGR01458 family HAD-type hydrolase [Flammeovirga kamogawensis]
MRFNQIKGILCDLDGVLYNDSVVIDGVIDTIKTLKDQGYQFLFVTNTSGITSEELYHKLITLGIPVDENEILSPPLAALNYTIEQGYKEIEVLAGSSIKALFEEKFTINTTTPEAIIISDIGKNWDYQLMNNLFLKVLNGSKLIGLHKGKFWKASDGLRIDIGAFIKGLEFATSTEAICIGKPDKSFYESAIEKINLPAHQLLMIGDDIIGDIQGAKAAKLTAIQVKTGKYRKELTDNADIKPDQLIEDFNSLPSLLITR